MSQLEGRVALVTGGARGIGAAACASLAEAGANVVVSDIRDGAETAAATGGAYFRHDVGDEADWAAAIAFAEKTFGGLDILVNNAGIFFSKPIVETTLEEFQRMQRINVEGVFLGMKHAIPAIAARAQKWDGGGAIVNISSIAGLVGGSSSIAYTASKGAVRLMTKAAAIECATLKLNIRVNSVHPGVIETPMSAEVMGDPEVAAREGPTDARKRLIKFHPVGRIGRPLDIANAITFLASDAAAFMTGAEMVVDGGITAQ